MTTQHAYCVLIAIAAILCTNSCIFRVTELGAYNQRLCRNAYVVLECQLMYVENLALPIF